MAKMDHQKSLIEAMGGKQSKGKQPASLSEALRGGTSEKYKVDKSANKKGKWSGD